MEYENIAVEARKYHYWRGFKAACLLITAIAIPVAIATAIYLNYVLDALK